MTLTAALTVALSACGGGGGGAVDDPTEVAGLDDDVEMLGLRPPEDNTVIDLGRFAEPVELDGECFAEVVLDADGADAQGQQQYVLTFVLNSNPDDDSELAEELSEDGCSEQQDVVYAEVLEVIDHTQNPNQPDPVLVSYVTKSGRRFLL